MRVDTFGGIDPQCGGRKAQGAKDPCQRGEVVGQQAQDHEEHDGFRPFQDAVGIIERLLPLRVGLVPVLFSKDRKALEAGAVDIERRKKESACRPVGGGVVDDKGHGDRAVEQKIDGNIQIAAKVCFLRRTGDCAIQTVCDATGQQRDQGKRKLAKGNQQCCKQPKPLPNQCDTIRGNPTRCHPAPN